MENTDEEENEADPDPMELTEEERRPREDRVEKGVTVAITKPKNEHRFNIESNLDRQPSEVGR